MPISNSHEGILWANGALSLVRIVVDSSSHIVCSFSSLFPGFVPASPGGQGGGTSSLFENCGSP